MSPGTSTVNYLRWVPKSIPFVDGFSYFRMAPLTVQMGGVKGDAEELKADVKELGDRMERKSEEIDKGFKENLTELIPNLII